MNLVILTIILLFVIYSLIQYVGEEPSIEKVYDEDEELLEEEIDSFPEIKEFKLCEFHWYRASNYTQYHDKDLNNLIILLKNNKIIIGYYSSETNEFYSEETGETITNVRAVSVYYPKLDGIAIAGNL